MEREAKEALILRLFRAYPAGESKVSRAMVDTYLKAVDFFPLRLVDIAVEQFITGQVQRDSRNRPFVPSADELATQIRTLRYEEGTTQRLLTAGRAQIAERDKDDAFEALRTPEAQARVKRMAEAFAEKINPKTRTPEQELAAKEALKLSDQRFADQFLTISEQVTISKSLAQQLGYACQESRECPD